MPRIRSLQPTRSELNAHLRAVSTAELGARTATTYATFTPPVTAVVAASPPSGQPVADFTGNAKAAA